MFGIYLEPFEFFAVVVFATVLLYILFAQTWIFFADSGIKSVWKPVIIAMILQLLVLAGWIFID